MCALYRSFATRLLLFPRAIKLLIVVAVDAVICVVSVFAAFYIRLGDLYDVNHLLVFPSISAILLALPLFFVFGLYRSIFRFGGLYAVVSALKAVIVFSIFYSPVFFAGWFNGAPRTIGVLQPILLFVLISSSRVCFQAIYRTIDSRRDESFESANALVYGAGVVGRQLVVWCRGPGAFRVLGFLDDDVEIQGHTIDGQMVYAPSELGSLVKKLHISNVLLALPNASRARQNRIIDQLNKCGVKVHSVPSIESLLRGDFTISTVRDVTADELLGREPVAPNSNLMGSVLNGRVILITGAGGSIGGEICKQILNFSPKKLILLDQSEFGLYSILESIRDDCPPDTLLTPVLGSITNAESIEKVLSLHKPEVVYHAAAYKHVPLVEANPIEAYKNNVLGTLNVLRAADDAGVAHFVLISSDKAVRPTSIMGITKRISEMVLQAFPTKTERIKVSMVRFGNVLASSGSVVPKFRQQIKSGGPLTVTHDDITRYFMTISEAAQLVIQASAMAVSREVFVLDMGEPVKIRDLAVRMVELSGLTVKSEDNPNGDIQIVTTGIRPGEKLYEELVIGDDIRNTPHPRIKVAKEDHVSWDELSQALMDFDLLCAEGGSENFSYSLKRFVSRRGAWISDVRANRSVNY